MGFDQFSGWKLSVASGNTASFLSEFEMYPKCCLIATFSFRVVCVNLAQEIHLSELVHTVIYISKNDGS